MIEIMEILWKKIIYTEFKNKLSQVVVFLFIYPTHMATLNFLRSDFRQIQPIVFGNISHYYE